MNKALILIVAAIIGLSGGLYLALSRSESPTAVVVRDYGAVEALRQGDMAKLQFVTRRGSDVPFTGEDGSELRLADYRGKIVLVNFWATWCAPCRVEMPHLSELQAELRSPDFEVVTIATGRNPMPAIQSFLAEIGVDNLPMHTDANGALARDMGVLGLPVTLILDRQGQEIARMTGDADWASDSAKAIITALVDG